MDIETLKSLGIDPETLGERIVEQAVESLLHNRGFDEDGEPAGTYASDFKRRIEAKIQEAVDAKIEALAAEHVVPKVGEMIENANMQQTSTYGEPKGEPMTFLEFIAARAEAYMSEPVNLQCESKRETKAYEWRAEGPRLTVLMRMYIRETLEKHARAAVTDVNKVIAENIKKSALDAITDAAVKLKVSVTA